jgi:hypothetical protein
VTPEQRVAVEICIGPPHCDPASRDPEAHDYECVLRDPELLDKIHEQMRAARSEAQECGRRNVELGTCRVYRHGCADGRAIENRLADRWREYALPHPKRDNCVEWVALAPRDSGKEG